MSYISVSLSLMSRIKNTANEIILFFSYNPKKIWRGQTKERKGKSFQSPKKKKNKKNFKKTNYVVLFAQGQIYITSYHLFIHLLNLQFNHINRNIFHSFSLIKFIELKNTKKQIQKR